MAARRLGLNEPAAAGAKQVPTPLQDEKKGTFRRRRVSAEIVRDVPEGEWKFLISKGTCRVTVTQAGDPRLLIPFQIEKIDENDGTLRGQVTLSVIVFDDEDSEKRHAANMMKSRLRGLCEAVNVDLAVSYPTEVSEASDFDPLFRALEGKRGTCWTVHRKLQAQSGETITDVEARFSKPARQSTGLEPGRKRRRARGNDKGA